MRNRWLIALSFTLLSCPLRAQPIGLWNFNDALAGITGGEREFTVDRGSGQMTADFAAGNVGNATGSAVNAQDGDLAGRALSLSGSGNNGRSLIWNVSTAGYQSILVSMATLRSSTGFSRNQFQYSLDGGLGWSDFGPPYDPGLSFSALTFDLTAIPGLSDNAFAAFRIVFDGATSGSGTNRIDNLLVAGASLPPPVSEVPEPGTGFLVLSGLGVLLPALLFRNRVPR